LQKKKKKKKKKKTNTQKPKQNPHKGRRETGALVHRDAGPFIKKEAFIKEAACF
jgi:hypothetical protein